MSQTVNGRVAIGFSKPLVGETDVSNGELVLTNPQPFARGVEVTITPDSTSDNSDFDADDTKAESVGGIFTGGTLDLVADECLVAAKRFTWGLPAATSGWIHLGDNQTIPYRSFGYLTQYISGGVKSWVPTILPRIRMNQLTKKAKTMPSNGTVEYGTQDYSGKIFRAEDSNRTWIIESEESYNTPEAAYAALWAKMGGSTTPATGD